MIASNPRTSLIYKTRMNSNVEQFEVGPGPYHANQRFCMQVYQMIFQTGKEITIMPAAVQSRVMIQIKQTRDFNLFSNYPKAHMGQVLHSQLVSQWPCARIFPDRILISQIRKIVLKMGREPGAQFNYQSKQNDSVTILRTGLPLC